MTSILRGLIAALILGISVPAALAQNFPTRPLRIIVPTAPGGGLDFVARLIGPTLTQGLGQTVVVDNRPGASGVIGLELTARATPDGYNLMVISATHVIYTTINKTSFNFFKDFAPISQLTAANYVLVVTPSLPPKTVSELVAYGKAHPGQLNYASSGIASLQHLATEYFGAIEGVKFTHVPYKGVAPALLDTIANEIQMQFAVFPAAFPHVNSGRLRGLGVSTEKRAPGLPNLPPIAETVPGYVTFGWYSVVAPKGTPPAVLEKASVEIVKAAREPVAARVSWAPELNSVQPAR